MAWKRNARENADPFNAGDPVMPGSESPSDSSLFSDSDGGLLSGSSKDSKEPKKKASKEASSYEAPTREPSSPFSGSSADAASASPVSSKDTRKADVAREKEEARADAARKAEAARADARRKVEDARAAFEQEAARRAAAKTADESTSAGTTGTAGATAAGGTFAANTSTIAGAPAAGGAYGSAGTGTGGHAFDPEAYERARKKNNRAARIVVIVVAIIVVINILGVIGSAIGGALDSFFESSTSSTSSRSSWVSDDEEEAYEAAAASMLDARIADVLSGADADTYALIVSALDNYFESCYGFTISELAADGVDGEDYAAWFCANTTYYVDGAYYDSSDGTTALYVDVTSPDAYTFVDYFENELIDIFGDLYNLDVSAVTDAQRAQVADAYEFAKDEALNGEDANGWSYLGFTGTLEDGEWVIDEEGWISELDYVFWFDW